MNAGRSSSVSDRVVCVIFDGGSSGGVTKMREEIHRETRRGIESPIFMVANQL